MSKAVVVQYRTRSDDAAAENQQVVQRVFDELHQDRPQGLRYATFRLADGVSFVHIAVFDGDGNPLAESAAFAEFQRGLGDRLDAPPVPSDATLVDSYRFLAG